MSASDYGEMVFPSVGGIAIHFDDEKVLIAQDDLSGGDAAVIEIPRSLLNFIVRQLLSGMDYVELLDTTKDSEFYTDLLRETPPAAD